MQIPYPYKSCNQDKQRIFGENDSQAREFREFEAINSIPAQFWKIPKKQYILQRIQHKKLFYFETPYFPYPPSEAAFVTNEVYPILWTTLKSSDYHRLPQWGAGVRWTPLPKAEAPTDAAAETPARWSP